MSAPPVRDRWLPYRRRAPNPAIRLFCFPYAGGTASAFRPWPDAAPAGLEVCGVQYPGREGRLAEPLLTRLEPLVEALAGALRPHLDAPFAFFGHSLGAFVGFELARTLEAQGLRPVHVFVSACRAPHRPDNEPPIYHLPDEAFLEQVRRLNGVPEAVVQDRQLLELVLPIVRADFEMHDTYRYAGGAPLGCPITAFGGVDDRRVLVSDLSAWRDHTAAAFAALMLPGDHFFVHAAYPSVLETVAAALRLGP